MNQKIIAPYTQAKFKPFGKWDEAVQKMGRLNPEIKDAALSAQKALCGDILNAVKWHIIKQDLPWKKLSSKYRAKKLKYGRDRRKLISHGLMYENITMWKRANGWQYFVGIPRGIYGLTVSGKTNKRDLATVAISNEFGRHRRPLWGPTIQEFGGAKGIKVTYIDLFEKRLRRRGLGKYVKRLKVI